MMMALHLFFVFLKLFLKMCRDEVADADTDVDVVVVVVELLPF